MTSFYDTRARVALSIYATALASRRVISEVKLAETLLAANACSQAPETDSANFDSPALYARPGRIRSSTVSARNDARAGRVQ